MASAGCTVAASSCCRAMLTLRIDRARSTGGWLRTGVRMQSSTTSNTATSSLGTLCRNETWCRRWWNISRKGLSTSTRTFTPSLSSMFSKEQQDIKEARTSREHKESKDHKTPKESKKKDKNSVPGITSEVFVEYHRGLPRITLPLPSRPEKCMFTLKPITQTIGDFIEILKVEDPAIVEASITTTNGVQMGASNRIETLLLDDFNIIINDKVYPVSPPFHIEKPKENLQQLKDVQALVHQLYEAFNAREYHAELEREVMLHLEEVKLELEPLEQLRMELEESAARRSHLASWGVLVLMSMQFGCLARLTWWEYSWDIMEPVTYFVTYATAMGCYIYFLLTRQEYMLPEVFHREHLIGLHKRAKKLGFDLELYNRLKDEAHELETMLRLIRGPLHQHQCVVEQKRQERLARATRSSTSSSSSSSSSSRSRSRSPSPSPEDKKKEGEKKPPVPSAVISN